MYHWVIGNSIIFSMFLDFNTIHSWKVMLEWQWLITTIRSLHLGNFIHILAKKGAIFYILRALHRMTVCSKGGKKYAKFMFKLLNLRYKARNIIIFVVQIDHKNNNLPIQIFNNFHFCIAIFFLNRWPRIKLYKASQS